MHGSEQAAATTGYSALVRGPSPFFPRGGVWMFCVWYAIPSLVLFFFVPLWYALAALPVFSAAAAVMIMVFTRATSRAFAADCGGIWLGKNDVPARRVRLEWEQIRQLSICPYPHGSILQVLISSGTRATRWHGRIGNLALLELPLGFCRARPELLTVFPDPPRYRVPLANVTPDELRSALSGSPRGYSRPT